MNMQEQREVEAEARKHWEADVRAVQAFFLEFIRTKKPADCATFEGGINGDWFDLNDEGQVVWNFRTVTLPVARIEYIFDADNREYSDRRTILGDTRQMVDTVWMATKTCKDFRTIKKAFLDAQGGAAVIEKLEIRRESLRTQLLSVQKALVEIDGKIAELRLKEAGVA